MKDLKNSIFSILTNLKDIEGLKQLFWSELNYNRINNPLSRDGWPKRAGEALAENPLLLAGHKDFAIIYGRLNGNLNLTPERAVVNHLLKEHPYALFVFSDNNLKEWHFVNVKLAIDEDVEKNRDTQRRRLFRRIKIGPYERLRTAVDRLTLLDFDSIHPDIFGVSPLAIQHAHDEAFDVEQVTRQFFSEYQAVINIFQEDLTRQTNDRPWAHDYALQFLNRCMFLYFIQRKKWLGDNPDFLHDFWKKYRQSGQKADLFFEKWLKLLFFEAFNNKFHGGHDHFPKEIREALALAPYLNGGLFQTNEIDQKYGFTISDTRFEQIFTFLERYNFTIAEDSPLDQEVAVDPEMIGKVYESLVNVSTEADTRGDAGIFYTPRTEIDLMCRLTLVDNLANHLGQGNKSLLYETVFAFEVDEKIAADNALAMAKLWEPFTEKLRQLTVLDPACGSGSFLLGMLNILDDLQERAARQLGLSETSYERKKRIIGQSLYGVDVMDWACHIAELRLWLALIIDAEMSQEDLHIRTEPLLPHFTFNIRCGDSLVQEIGGINWGHRRKFFELSSSLKTRISKLKTEKLKFYDNDPSCQFQTVEQAKQEELRLYRDIVKTRYQELDNRAKILRQKIAEAKVPMQLEGFLKKSPQQLDLMQGTKEKEIKEISEELEELRQAEQTLRSVQNIPFVWDISFVEIFTGDSLGFDIVIGNPPYVRQENISDPTMPREKITTDNKKIYKAKLAKSVYQVFPKFFDLRPGAAAPGRKIDAKSDLYIYFYFHGLSLLNPKGSFCFITSNSWLDVGYGKDLQEFLLKHSHIILILDNQSRRSFAQADVNTIIALLSSPDDRGENGLEKVARFVMFKVPFEEILSPIIFEEIEEASERTSSPEYRIFPIHQNQLWEEGIELPEEEEENPAKGKIKAPLIKAAQYTGIKWGGKYLRAPEIYWAIVEKGKNKLISIEPKIGKVSTVSWSRLGKNKEILFHKSITNEKDDNYIPVLKSPREFDGILIESQNTKSVLKLTLIDVKQILRTPLVWDDIRGERHICRFNKDELAFTHNFHGINIFNKDLNWFVLACLNSTLVWLLIEILGRRGLGGGGIRMLVNDLKSAPILLDPNIFSNKQRHDLESAIYELSKRPVYPVRQEISIDEKGIPEIFPDRRALDKVIFEVLGLTEKEKTQTYKTIVSLVEDRFHKAESLKSGNRLKRLTAAAKTGGIWADLPDDLENKED